jgi:hypothetical protein
MLSVALDGGGVVAEIDREHAARYHPQAPGGLFHSFPARVKECGSVCRYFSDKVWPGSAVVLV